MSGSPQAEFDGKAFAAGLSTAPGVYRMYAADDALLYVGKARALRNRGDAGLSAAAQAVVAAAMARHKADRLVVVVNQGGDLVTSVIRGVDALVPIKAVHVVAAVIFLALGVGVLWLGA